MKSIRKNHHYRDCKVAAFVALSLVVNILNITVSEKIDTVYDDNVIFNLESGLSKIYKNINILVKIANKMIGVSVLSENVKEKEVNIVKDDNFY